MMQIFALYASLTSATSFREFCQEHEDFASNIDDRYAHRYHLRELTDRTGASSYLDWSTDSSGECTSTALRSSLQRN